MSESLRSRIYVGKLHYDVRERDIERFFKDFGKIKDINMKNGYAFVDFEDNRDADDAVYEMDGKELLGDRVSVEHCKGGRDRRDDRRSYGGDPRGSSSSTKYKNSFSLFERPFNTKHRVIVEGLSSSTDWRDLKDFFRRVAEVTFADAHRFKSGEGVADFRSSDDVRRVIRELDDTKLNGRRVTLREDKAASRSRSRSRSPRRAGHGRSKSRSRSRDDKSPERRSPTPKKKKSRSPRRSRSRDDKRSKTPEKRERSKSKTPKRERGSQENDRDLKESDTFERSRSRSPEPDKTDVKDEKYVMEDRE